MSGLPIPLYSASQVRELDRRAIELHKIPGAELMERAGRSAFDVLRVRFPRARRITVVCGPGNNGGDGYVVARWAKKAGLEPVVFAVGTPRAGGDAATMRTRCQEGGVPISAFGSSQLSSADLIVDALLGTGLDREVTGDLKASIEAMNAANRPILAIDIPSGLHADSGRTMGAAVRADVTVSFIGLKVGLLTADGPDHSGEILFEDLGVPTDIYDAITPIVRRIVPEEFSNLLRPRRRNTNKGRFGHVLVIGGGRGMPGAARLCGEAALRAGAGLVTVATHPSHAAILNAARPELLVSGIRGARDLAPLIERATVIALGPGLSQDAWAKAAHRAALSSGLPIVADADALNLLSSGKPPKIEDWILTPHPGEAARLLKTTIQTIQQDRVAAAKNIAKRFNGVCVLKGTGSLIASDSDVWLCDRGNPGMASGGTGDVLTGLLAGLRAQGMSSEDAAKVGVWVHAAAGDEAANEGERGLIASDLLKPIRHFLNP